jgi:transposase
MSDDELKALDPDTIDDVSSFREMMRQLQALVMTLNALIVELRAQLTAKENENAELRRALLGPKSERKPKKTKTSASKGKKPPTEEEKARRRRGRQKSKQNRDERNGKLDEQPVEHPAPETCPKCNGTGPFVPLSPDISVEIEYLGERLLKLLHNVEKKLCPCGHIFSGDSPDRVTEGTHYGPGLYANAVVSKCADALPLNRISKRFARGGLHMPRSTLTDLYHRAAELLEPIHTRLLELVAASFYVNADETSQPVMDKEHCRRGFIWTFIAESIIVYIFSATRSGDTPTQILKGTVGKLQVDGYTGYNQVCLPDGRERIGCIAHCRRYFHKARDKCAEEADHCLGVILNLYRVEYDAAARDILGTDAHRFLREQRSQKIMDEWKLWLEKHKDRHTPKSPMGRAIRYTLNQWEHLTKFIADPKLRLDNNISEAALRIIALGRDNFRWVGHNVSGHNLAVLQTIVATCIANDVNPQDYITDVLIRVQTHPASRIDELLPMNWQQKLSPL